MSIKRQLNQVGLFFLHFPSKAVCVPLSWRKVCNHGNFWCWKFCRFLSPSSSDMTMSTMIISIYCYLEETMIVYWKNDNNRRNQCQLGDTNKQSLIWMNYVPWSLISLLKFSYQSFTLKYIEIGLLLCHYSKVKVWDFLHLNFLLWFCRPVTDQWAFRENYVLKLANQSTYDINR